MRWIAHLEGGPKRVNHAAVPIGDRIYSFGGYCSGEKRRRDEPIDVHCLYTHTFRWRLIPSNEELAARAEAEKLAKERAKKQENKVRAVLMQTETIKQQRDKASTSASTSVASSGEPINQSRGYNCNRRKRARSVADLHPLGQLRLFRPPIAEAEQGEGNDEDENGEKEEEKEGEVVDEDKGERVREKKREQHEHGQGEERRQFALVEDDELAMNASDELGYVALDGGEDNEIPTSSDQEENFDSDTDHEEYGRPINNALEQAVDDGGDSDFEDFAANGLPNLGGIRMVDAHQAMQNALQLQQLQHLQQVVALDREIRNKEVPYQRYGHTVVEWRGKAYLWGGRSDPLGSSQHLHEYDPATNNWSIVSTSEDLSPPARDGHSAVVYKDQMYIFGGFEEIFHRFSQEVYAFDFLKREWRQVITRGEPPQHRDFHTACVLDDKMWIFGGRSDEMGQQHSGRDVYCNKMKYLDLITNQWNDVVPKSVCPTGRRSHSVWVHNNCFYMFGGYRSTSDQHFSELYEYNPRINEWRLLYPSGQGPSPRRRQCTVVVKKKVYLFGGTQPDDSKPHHSVNLATEDDGSSLLDLSDMYVLDLDSRLKVLCAQACVNYGFIQDRLRDILPKELRQ